MTSVLAASRLIRLFLSKKVEGKKREKHEEEAGGWYLDISERREVFNNFENEWREKDKASFYITSFSFLGVQGRKICKDVQTDKQYSARRTLDVLLLLFFSRLPVSGRFPRRCSALIQRAVRVLRWEREWLEAIFFYPALSLPLSADRLGFVVVIGGN